MAFSHTGSAALVSLPLLRYPRTPHLEGSRQQPGDAPDVQPLAPLVGRHAVIEERIARCRSPKAASCAFNRAGTNCWAVGASGSSPPCTPGRGRTRPCCWSACKTATCSTANGCSPSTPCSTTGCRIACWSSTCGTARRSVFSPPRAAGRCWRACPWCRCPWPTRVPCLTGWTGSGRWWGHRWRAARSGAPRWTRPSPACACRMHCAGSRATRRHGRRVCMSSWKMPTRCWPGSSWCGQISCSTSWTRGRTTASGR